MKKKFEDIATATQKHSLASTNMILSDGQAMNRAE